MKLKRQVETGGVGWVHGKSGPYALWPSWRSSCFEGALGSRAEPEVDDEMVTQEKWSELPKRGIETSDVQIVGRCRALTRIWLKSLRFRR